eukprot:NODE_2717_length_481_cov_76.543981_g2141_i0.p1 GENE.NODE_2717_length_481_cov_76.543981_g2141_i0~~NODE_2717_length_481_cov_76.543981_g2141_i0.p1  ORF type:complete len:138 (-),score=25.51 NODE_2717_length_481_cov_76.543981_g2141_i0:67-444(-)
MEHLFERCVHNKQKSNIWMIGSIIGRGHSGGGWATGPAVWKESDPARAGGFFPVFGVVGAQPPTPQIRVPLIRTASKLRVEPNQVVIPVTDVTVFEECRPVRQLVRPLRHWEGDLPTPVSDSSVE